MISKEVWTKTTLWVIIQSNPYSIFSYEFSVMKPQMNNAQSLCFWFVFWFIYIFISISLSVCRPLSPAIWFCPGFFPTPLYKSKFVLMASTSAVLHPFLCLIKCNCRETASPNWGRSKAFCFLFLLFIFYFLIFVSHPVVDQRWCLCTAHAENLSRTHAVQLVKVMHRIATGHMRRSKLELINRLD